MKLGMKDCLKRLRHFNAYMSTKSCSEDEKQVLGYISMYMKHGITSNEELDMRWGQQHTIKIAQKAPIKCPILSKYILWSNAYNSTK
jgi:hypothetical protein